MNTEQQDRLQHTIGDLMQPKECMRCRTLFCEMDAMGAWGCRTHTGHVQTMMRTIYGTQSDTFTCCGTSPFCTHAAYAGRDVARGCQRLDHMTKPGLPKTLVIPLDRAHVLFGDRLLTDTRPGITCDKTTNSVRSVRYEGYGRQGSSSHT